MFRCIKSPSIFGVLGHHLRFVAGLLAAILITSIPMQVMALPMDGQVQKGSANISSSGKTTTINQSSDKAVIKWNKFDVASDETVNFNQNGKTSSVLNKMGGGLSTINGAINANGQVFLVNPDGILFGAGSKVNVGGLVASTLSIADEDFMNGNYNFNNKDSVAGKITNLGTINSNGGFVGLLGPQIENRGTINANGGSVFFGAGDNVVFSTSANGLVNLVVGAGSADASIANSGTIQSDGGQIQLVAKNAADTAKLIVNNTGVIQANTVGTKNGKIYLGAEGGNLLNEATLSATGLAAGQKGGEITMLAKNIAVLSGSKIDTSGDIGGGDISIGGGFQGQGTAFNAETVNIQSGVDISSNAVTKGNGGNVVVWSDDTTAYKGSISTKGGANGGDGGRVEVSGKKYLAFDGKVDTTAAKGKTGSLLLDPADINITAGSDSNGLLNDSNYTAATSGTSNPFLNGVKTVNYIDQNNTASIITKATIESLLTTTNVRIDASGGSGTGSGNIELLTDLSKTSTTNGLEIYGHNINLNTYDIDLGNSGSVSLDATYAAAGADGKIQQGTGSVITAKNLTAKAYGGIGLTGNNIVENVTLTNNVSGDINYTSARSTGFTVSATNSVNGNLNIKNTAGDMTVKKASTLLDDINLTSTVSGGKITLATAANGGSGISSTLGDLSIQADKIVLAGNNTTLSALSTAEFTNLGGAVQLGGSTGTVTVDDLTNVTAKKVKINAGSQSITTAGTFNVGANVDSIDLNGSSIATSGGGKIVAKSASTDINLSASGNINSIVTASVLRAYSTGGDVNLSLVGDTTNGTMSIKEINASGTSKYVNINATGQNLETDITGKGIITNGNDLNITMAAGKTFTVKKDINTSGQGNGGDVVIKTDLFGSWIGKIDTNNTDGATSSLTITSTTATKAIDLTGTVGSTTALGLSGMNVATKNLVIGDSTNSGGISTTSAITTSTSIGKITNGKVTLSTGGDITLGQNITMDSNTSLGLVTAKKVTATGAIKGLKDLNVSAATGITMSADNNASTVTLKNTTSGDLSYKSAATSTTKVTADNNASAGKVTINSSAGDLNVSSSGIKSNNGDINLTVATGKTLRLQGDVNSTTRAGGTAVTASTIYVNADDMNMSGNKIQAGATTGTNSGTVQFKAVGANSGLKLSGATIDLNNTTAKNVKLIANGTGDINLSNGTAFVLDANTALTMTAANVQNDFNTTGSITAKSLVVNAGGKIGLTGDNNISDVTLINKKSGAAASGDVNYTASTTSSMGTKLTIDTNQTGTINVTNKLGDLNLTSLKASKGAGTTAITNNDTNKTVRLGGALDLGAYGAANGSTGDLNITSDRMAFGTQTVNDANGTMNLATKNATATMILGTNGNIDALTNVTATKVKIVNTGDINVTGAFTTKAGSTTVLDINASGKIVTSNATSSLSAKEVNLTANSVNVTVKTDTISSRTTGGDTNLTLDTFATAGTKTAIKDINSSGMVVISSAKDLNITSTGIGLLSAGGAGKDVNISLAAGKELVVGGNIKSYAGGASGGTVNLKADKYKFQGGTIDTNTTAGETSGVTIKTTTATVKLDVNGTSSTTAAGLQGMNLTTNALTIGDSTNTGGILVSNDTNLSGKVLNGGAVTLSTGGDITINKALALDANSSLVLDASKGKVDSNSSITGATAIKATANKGIKLAGSNTIADVNLTNKVTGTTAATGDINYKSAATSTTKVTADNNASAGKVTINSSAGDLNVSSSGIKSNNGDINLTVATGKTLNLLGDMNASSRSGAKTTATIYMTDDNLTIASGKKIASGALSGDAGAIVIKTATASKNIDLNGTTGTTTTANASTLFLAKDFVDAVKTNSLTIGSSSMTGDINVSGAVDFNTSKNISGTTAVNSGFKLIVGAGGDVNIDNNITLDKGSTKVEVQLGTGGTTNYAPFATQGFIDAKGVDVTRKSGSTTTTILTVDPTK